MLLARSASVAILCSSNQSGPPSADHVSLLVDSLQVLENIAPSQRSRTPGRRLPLVWPNFVKLDRFVTCSHYQASHLRCAAQGYDPPLRRARRVGDGTEGSQSLVVWDGRNLCAVWPAEDGDPERVLGMGVAEGGRDFTSRCRPDQGCHLSRDGNGGQRRSRPGMKEVYAFIPQATSRGNET